MRACQRLAEDPIALLQAAKPIFEDLNAWRATTSAPEPFRPEHHSETGNYPITVYFAYLTLGLYVWRALLRSAAVSLPPAHIIEADEQPVESQSLQDDSVFLENLNIDLDTFPSIDLPDIEWHFNDNGSNSGMLAKELYQAAQAWASNLADFAWNISLHKLREFWHYCK